MKNIDNSAGVGNVGNMPLTIPLLQHEALHSRSGWGDFPIISYFYSPSLLVAGSEKLKTLSSCKQAQADRATATCLDITSHSLSSLTHNHQTNEDGNFRDNPRFHSSHY